MKAPVCLEKEQFFDFLLHHLKLRLSVWLGKPELLSWRSLCKAGNALPGTSLSNALLMGKHNALEIFCKKHSSAGAVLKGTAGHNMWSKRKITINYSLALGFEGTPVWKNQSPSTFFCTISSLDCRFGWENLSFSAWCSLCKAGNALPVLAMLCGWGSIL